MTIRTTNFDAIAASAPLDRQASVVRDGSGDQWENQHMSTQAQHWKAPPLPTHRRPHNTPDYTGAKIGRMTIVSFHGYSGKSNPVAVWLARCACGDYEVRRADTIKRNANPDACCMPCQRAAAICSRDTTSKSYRRKAGALLDRLARESKGQS